MKATRLESSTPHPGPLSGRGGEGAALEARLAVMEEEVRRLKLEPRPRAVFDGDDQIFLTWVLGFTAGANLERDGERGERIFARCRALHDKLAPVAVPAKPEMNGS